MSPGATMASVGATPSPYQDTGNLRGRGGKKKHRNYGRENELKRKKASDLRERAENGDVEAKRKREEVLARNAKRQRYHAARMKQEISNNQTVPVNQHTMHDANECVPTPRGKLQFPTLCSLSYSFQGASCKSSADRWQ